MEECPYIEGLASINETLLIKELTHSDLEMLLSVGFRHFGEIFFRPICAHCRSCISIRIPVQKFIPSRSVKRLLNRSKHFTFTLEKPCPSRDAFRLYLSHKKRFKREVAESFRHYVRSFFAPFPFNRMLTIRDGETLVAVSHLDITANAMSAVYCYYDEEHYGRFSPGKLAVYKEIEWAKEQGIQFLYLGFYVPQNRHTSYKLLYKPNQLLTGDNHWIDYMDAGGNILVE